jgi:phosphorylase kinase gamma subunit
MEGKFSFTSTEWRDVTNAPKDLISRILVVDCRQRPTVEECLNHEFFRDRRESIAEAEPFHSRRLFRRAVTGIRFLVRLKRLKLTPQPLSLQTASLDPYRIKTFRKVIDGAAFKIYGHWVKKNDGQNRAAMFEHCPKIDLKRAMAAEEAAAQNANKVIFKVD